MAEVRKNAGRGRLSPGAKCCVCDEQFLPGQEYAVDRCGPGFYYMHPACHEANEARVAAREERVEPAKPKRKPAAVAVKKPVPDVQVTGRGSVADVFYRGYHYVAAAYEEKGTVVWGLFHPSHDNGNTAIAEERNPEVGVGGLVSWLLTNR